MMLITMRTGASLKEVGTVLKSLEEAGLTPHLARGEMATRVGVVAEAERLADLGIGSMAGVERVVPMKRPFKLASREFRPESTIVQVGAVAIGGPEVIVMAGPCAVESYEQTLEAARAVKAAGAKILRGGAFKPRTSPYSFQGLGLEGLRILSQVSKEVGLPVVTEVLSPGDVEAVAEAAAILQIGARNMQNQALLAEAARSGKPVLLKRGLMSTLEELYLSAEYLLSNGNFQVILCERGIRTFERYTRNTLDVAVVPLTKRLTHLPIVIDPSHATGDSDLVHASALAGVAAGADGLLIEVHPDPEQALCDGAQSLRPEGFQSLMETVRRVAAAVGRPC